MNMKTLFITICRMMICLMVATGVGSATTVIPLSVENLTQISSHVVEGHAVSSWAQWNAAHTVIFTYTEFQVSRTLKGQTGSAVVVRQLGGSLDGITEKVAGVRHWQTGDQALLFLRPGEAQDGSLVVTGLMQGNFLVYHAPNGETLVSNGAPDTSAYRVGAPEVTTYKGSAMRLDEMENRILKAVRQ